MYVAVVGAIAGQAVVLLRSVLVGYGLVIATTVATFVRWYEEPTLARQFGDDYEQYCRAVRARRPRWHPWTGPDDGGGRTLSA